MAAQPWHAIVRLALLLFGGFAEAEEVNTTQHCQDEASCRARLTEITRDLDELRTGMQRKQAALSLLADLRAGVLSGRRVELPSAQRRHLEKGSPLVGKRPLTTALPWEKAKAMAENCLIYLDPPETGPHGQELANIQQIHDVMSRSTRRRPPSMQSGEQSNRRPYLQNTYCAEDFILHATSEYGNVLETSETLPLLSYLANVLVTRGARAIRPHSDNLIFSMGNPADVEVEPDVDIATVSPTRITLVEGATARRPLPRRTQDWIEPGKIVVLGCVRVQTVDVHNFMSHFGNDLRQAAREALAAKQNDSFNNVNDDRDIRLELMGLVPPQRAIEMSFDARHRPVSTNVSRHFTPLRTLGEGTQVRFHAFMPLKKGSLMVVMSAESRLSVFDLQGDALLEGVDLGHAAGTRVTQMELSPTHNSHFVLTAADDGEMRVHSLKVVARKKSAEGEGQQLSVSTNFSCSFSIPAGGAGESRSLSAVLPVERGTQTYFVAGDSLGGVAVFFRNGTLKGRALVTEDPGGVRGLLHAQGGSVLFYSSRSFGFFSPAQVDVLYPPCSGWHSPVVDVVMDPSAASSRVVLALADGDVLVFSTSSGQTKACVLALKFPHVSPIPFKLYTFKGHVVGLPVPPEGAVRGADYLRELHFFSLSAMEAGYGVAPSRAVLLQASFSPRQPESLALLGGEPGGRAHAAIRFAGTEGVELYELSIRQPTSSSAVDGSSGGIPSWLSWLPDSKIAIFGVSLVCVVAYNVRKVKRRQQQQSRSREDDIDLRHLEQLRAERQRKAAASGARAPSAPDADQEEDDD
ncbi:unnamed protein product [Prorocentrum cordatum]|uniref:ER membrane protein complex subunit 1 n=1 Tax=Prorocentrum cordatum TaxID=2364126 RepID=A0ABN9W7N8_9DINO|nr:unnamed protein product [Polarella glacialis]